MRYESLEESGVLVITYEGEPLGLASFGILHANLQDIIDKVTSFELSEAGLIEPTWRRPKNLPPRPLQGHHRIVKAEIQEISVGSLHEVIAFSLLPALADPNVRAVLQNLVANIVWAISTSGVRGIVDQVRADQRSHRRMTDRHDPVDIGPNLREIALALSHEAGKGGAELRFRERSQHGECEVCIRILPE